MNHDVTSAPRKALFWSTFSASEPVLRIEVELILREKKKGSRIIGVYCDGVLPRCHVMRGAIKDHLFICGPCQLAWNRFVRPLLDHELRLNEPAEKIIGNVPLKQDDLRNYRFEGSDIGSAVLSTIKTDAGDDDPLLFSRKKDIAVRLAAAQTVHVRLGTLLDEHHPDIVYLFNGRQFDSRPLLRICQARSIPFKTYEKGIAPNTFILRENTTVHDITVTKAQFKVYLDSWHEKQSVAEHLDAIRKGYDIYGHGFRSRQAHGKIPSSFSKDLRNILIFHSSEDEYADVDRSLRLWIGSDFADFLNRLLDRFNDDTDLRIYLRLHPRLAQYQANSVRKLISLSHPRLVIIPPESPVDTFALACAATLCISYGSTAGPEAVMLGARVVCVGDCDYAGAGIMPDVKTIDDLIALVDAPERIECSLTRAQAYLEFLQCAGEPVVLASSEDCKINPTPDFGWINRFYESLVKLHIPVRWLGINRLLLLLVRAKILRPHK